MKNIVESALKNAEQQSQGTHQSHSSEFGHPEFFYIGFGDRGGRRIDAGLADRSYETTSVSPLEDIVTTASIGIDEQFPGSGPVPFDLLTRTTSEFDSTSYPPSDQPEQPPDFCLITGDIAATNSDQVLTGISELVDDTTTSVALLSTQDRATTLEVERLSSGIDSTVLIDESVIADGPLDGAEMPSEELVDRIIQDFVTDIVEITTVSSPIGVDYLEVRRQFDNGGLVVPYVARLDRSSLDVETIADSLIPLARTERDASGWFAYICGGAGLKLSELNRLREKLPEALESGLTFDDGVVDGRIHYSLGDTIVVSILETTA